MNDIDLSKKFKHGIRFQYGIDSIHSISTPARKSGSIFYPSLALVNEDYKKYSPPKCKQFSKCGFGETFCEK